jgi:hypothetical protein
MYDWLLETEDFEVAAIVGTVVGGPVSINVAVKDFLEN